MSKINITKKALPVPFTSNDMGSGTANRYYVDVQNWNEPYSNGRCSVKHWNNLISDL